MEYQYPSEEEQRKLQETIRQKRREESRAAIEKALGPSVLLAVDELEKYSLARNLHQVFLQTVMSDKPKKNNKAKKKQ